MKRTFLTLSALALMGWIYTLTMMGADGINSTLNGTTVTGGGAAPSGTVMTNNNVNAFVIFTNNQVSLSMNSSGVLILTNYAAASLGFSWGTNSVLKAVELNAGANRIGTSGQNRIFDICAFSSGILVANSGFSIESTATITGDANAAGIFRDSAGGIKVVRVNAGTAGALTNLTFGNGYSSGSVTATNGFASFARTLLAPISITVGSSPFNWTNSPASAGGGTNNVNVFVDGVSVTGTVGINGTTIFNTIGQCTVPLQPGEWTTITYTIGTPTATFKNF